MKVAASLDSKWRAYVGVQASPCLEVAGLDRDGCPDSEGFVTQYSIYCSPQWWVTGFRWRNAEVCIECLLLRTAFAHDLTWFDSPEILMALETLLSPDAES
jgi:hypothetical protein